MNEANESIGVLAIDAGQIYEFHDSEDGLTYFWNATEGHRLAAARQAEVLPLYLAEVGMTPKRILELYPELDRRKALGLPGVALLSPILFVPHRGKHVLIDGWHRVYRAAVQGFPCLPAYVLTEAEGQAIRAGGPRCDGQQHE